MALYGAIDKTKHFEEFADPLFTQEGVLSGATRKARCLSNLGLTAVAAEINTLAGVTAGTVAASKAVVVDANKDIGSFRDVTMRHLAAENGVFTGRVTTTDGVASGTAKVVGGRAFASVAAADAVTAVASNNAHVDFASTYSIPANTLKEGSVVKIKGYVNITDASGTDTLEVKLYIGGTTLLTTTAFDPDAAADFVMFEFELVSRAAPGAAVALTGFGKSVTEDGATQVVAHYPLAPTNHATNGALVVKASAKWSSNTANTSARLEMLNVEII